MEWTAEDVESAALRLSREERAHLAERLVVSLNEDATVEQAWTEEIRRRVDELRSGAIQTIPGGQVFDELENRPRRDQAKNDAARAILGTMTDAEIIEAARDRMDFRSELLEGLRAMRGANLANVFDEDEE
jgi:putative addiction module component (TIGR02574 family)